MIDESVIGHLMQFTALALDAKVKARDYFICRLAKKKANRQYKDLCKGVHCKQVEKVEDELTRALSPMFERQIESARDRLKDLEIDDDKDVRNKAFVDNSSILWNKTANPPSDQADQLASQIFDPREWDQELVDRALPPIARGMLEAMVSQADLMERGMKLFVPQVKTSTATEWLANANEVDLEDLVFETPFGNVSMKIATDYPEWMKVEIKARLQESFSQDYWDDISNSTLGDVTQYLNEGVTEGWSIKKMANEMAKHFVDQDYAKTRSLNIARTESGNALNAARTASFDQLVAEVGDKVVLKKSWLSVLGTTTRLEHANLDGVPADKNGMWTLVGIAIRWPSDIRLSPSQRCNCFPGRVLVNGSFSGAQRSRYEGVVAEIVTASGVRLTVTPNHPIMTKEGWVGAGSIKPGDQVVSYRSQSNSPFSLDKIDHKPAFIKKVFEAIRAGGAVSGRVEVIGTQVDDFYGDGKFLNSDIDVVLSNWKLLRDGEIKGFEKSGDFVFSFVDASLPREFGSGAGGFPFGGIDASSSGLPCLAEPLARVLLGRISPSGSLSVGIAPDLYSSFLELSGEDTYSITRLFRNPLQRDARQVFLDEVVEIRNVDFSGHVYDLQSDNGLIVARDEGSVNTDIGIITHNCQCTVVTEFGMQDDEAQALIDLYDRRVFEELEAQRKKSIEDQLVEPTKHLPGQHNQLTHGHGKGGGKASEEYKGPVDGSIADNGDYVSGKVGSSLGVDTSHLSNSSMRAQALMSDINLLEESIAEGDWSVIGYLEQKSSTHLKPELLEAIAVAKKIKEGDLNSLPKGATPSADPAIATDANWKKIGGQLGTEKGGQYEVFGQKFYVKQPDDESRAHNEVLALKLYEAAGASAVKGNLVEIEGKKSVATEWVESQKSDFNDADFKAKAAEDFAVHAWLNNRDAVGAGSENPMDNIRNVNGKPVLVDAGGSLDRAGIGGGGKKEFSSNPSEWDTLRDPDINPSMAKVYGDMTPQQLAKSAAKLNNISDEMITELVDKYHGGTQGQKDQMAATLRLRKKKILDKATELDTSIGLKPKSPAEAAKPPSTPTTKAMAVPPPPVTKGAVASKFNAIHDAAATGDISKVEAIKTNPNAKSNYPKKIHAYKQEVLSSMKSGGKVSDSHKPAVDAAKSKPPAKKIKVDAGLFPDTPEFVSKSAANVAANKAAAEAAKKLAEDGDLDSLKAMGNTIPPSPKLKEWHAELVSNVSEQLNPPPPPTSLGKDYLAVSQKVGIKKVGLKKVGRWAVQADIQVPEGVPTSKEWKTTPKVGFWKEGQTKFDSMPVQLRQDYKSYTGGGYNSINSSMHSGGSEAGNRISRSVIEKGTTLPVGTRLSRKYTPSTNLSSHDLKVGQVVTDKAVMSTSTDKKKWSGTVHMHLTAGTGVKGMPVDSFSSNKGEKEVILASNQRIMVTSVSKKKTSGEGAWLVEGVILETQDNQCCA